MTKAEKVKAQQERLGAAYEKAVSEGYRSCILKRTCLRCGKVFYTRNQRQIYCPATDSGTSCALKANKERHQELRQAELKKVCVVCGCTFTAKKVDAAYCSAACKQKAYRRRAADS